MNSDRIRDVGNLVERVKVEARADALREAAGIAAKFGLIDNPTASQIYRGITALIDQPQEDVCEWEKYTRSSSGWLYTTSCGSILVPVRGATCICGKPIKVTHGDKV